MKTGATFARGKSKQDYATPLELIQAAEKRFGKIQFDLAAHSRNAKCADYYSLECGENSLTLPWPEGKLCWLNPPYDTIAPWALRCCESGARVLLLVPASVGANWFGDFVLNKSLVLALSPRLTFIGAKDPYPKDCILCAFGFGKPGFEFWRWNKQQTTTKQKRK